MLGSPQRIESGEHIVRARRTAAASRVAMGLAAILLILDRPSLVEHSTLGVIGFATIVLSSAVQLAAPRLSLLTLEESLSASAGVLIIGFSGQRVDVIQLLWLVAVASGVLARGGRVHWVGRTVLLFGLLLPVLRDGTLQSAYAGFALGAVSLLLVAGRLTSELNVLLRHARRQADSVETLLLAGDIAARMSGRVEARPGELDGTPVEMSEDERASARNGLIRLIGGDGLSMVVQPIVDITSGEIHAYEALARFGEARPGSTPLHWFALADELGGRASLERACLREALELLARRPAGTRLSVNLSAPVLSEPATIQMFEEAAAARSQGLDGLIIEITEETLVHGDAPLDEAIEPLLAHGALLAVDDMGAGYSGLRQITAVRPAYLKLDRSLVSGIDSDPERSALVTALVGYARQVGAQLVVEGVETTAELQALRRIGVRLVQGFRLSRPGQPWPDVDAEDAREGAPAAPRSGADLLDPSDWVAAGLLDPSDWAAADTGGLERASRPRAARSA